MAVSQRRADQGWELRGQDAAEPFPRPPHGPRSLAVMTLEHVVHNISHLTRDDVDALSVRAADNLHMLLSSRGELCFHAWKLLVHRLLDPAYHPDAKGSGRWRFHAAFRRPRSPLHVFTRPPCTWDSSCMVHLRIAAPDGSVGFGVDAFMALATLPNLVLLELAADVSDSLTRGWSLSPHAFCRLQMLRLWGCSDALTPACLPAITRFPSLAVLDVSVLNYDEAGWRGVRSPAEQLDWTCSRQNHDPDQLLYVLRDILGMPDSDHELDEQTPAASSVDADQDSAQASAFGFALFRFYLAHYTPTSRPVEPLATLCIGPDRPFTQARAGARRLIFVRTPTTMSLSLRVASGAHGPVAPTRKRPGQIQPPRLRAKKRKGADVNDLLASFRAG